MNNANGNVIFKMINNNQEERRKLIAETISNIYGYSDSNNPFGDPELSQPFEWKLKNEKLEKMGLNSIIETEDYIKKLKQAKKEIDRVRLKRLKREEEKLIEKQIYNNLKDNKIISDERNNKNEQFMINQERLRREIRIKECRESPIDFLTKIILIWSFKIPIPSEFLLIKEYSQPLLILSFLDNIQLSQLRIDMENQILIEKDRLKNENYSFYFLDSNRLVNESTLTKYEINDFIEYWTSLHTILLNFENINLIHELDRNTKNEIENVIKDKTSEELHELSNKIENCMTEAVSKEDYEFWYNIDVILKVKKYEERISKIFINFLKK